MYCSKCGAKLPDDYQFCTKCGARVVHPGAGPSPHVEEDAGTSEDARLRTSVGAGSVRRTTWVKARGAAATGDPSATHAMPAGAAPSPAAASSGAPRGADGNANAAEKGRPFAAGRPSPASGAKPGPQGAAAPSPLDITMQQPVVADSESSGYEVGSSRRRGLPPAAIAAICVAVVVVIVAAVWFALAGAPAQDAAHDAPSQEQDDSAATVLDLSATSISTAGYPQVVLDLELTSDDEVDLGSLTAGDFVLEEAADGSSGSQVTIDRFSVSADEGTCRIVYTSSLPQDDATHTLRIDLDELSGLRGGTSVRFTVDVPADDADDAEEQTDDEQAAPASDGDYVLADSDTRLYTADELESLSDWELEIARNEIYARHGREFSNEALREYFEGQPWYEPRYSAEEFDALDGVLNQTEVANAELILSIEQSRSDDES